MKKLFLGFFVLLASVFLWRNFAVFRPTSTHLMYRSDRHDTLGASANQSIITRVIDGDTVELGSGERVRYIGMDTPETVDPRKPVQCFGEEASKRNRELVEGKSVRLEKDVSERDKYGRLLRYVWVAGSTRSTSSGQAGSPQGDKMINLELVEEGYATAFTYPPDVKYAKEFVAAERKAREAKIGLWRSCR